MDGDAERLPDASRCSEASSTSDTSPCRRVRGEYREMPGLLLTEAQAVRLLGLEPDVCRNVLATLVAEGFLVRTRDGRYARQGACPRCQ
jgi:hypothetical protein